jgi:hypothetical protein
MFELKKEGFNRRIVTSTINNGINDLCTIGEEIARLENVRDEFVHQSKTSLGVYTLETEIDRLRRAKESHIKAFDNEASVHERKAKHRALWLDERGRSNVMPITPSAPMLSQRWARCRAYVRS